MTMLRISCDSGLLPRWWRFGAGFSAFSRRQNPPAVLLAGLIMRLVSSQDTESGSAVRDVCRDSELRARGIGQKIDFKVVFAWSMTISSLQNTCADRLTADFLAVSHLDRDTRRIRSTPLENGFET